MEGGRGRGKYAVVPLALLHPKATDLGRGDGRKRGEGRKCTIVLLKLYRFVATQWVQAPLPPPPLPTPVTEATNLAPDIIRPSAARSGAHHSRSGGGDGTAAIIDGAERFLWGGGIGGWPC